ncbi:T-complex protein 1 subunit gamma [Dermatophagoides pteronyssinus]|uniref:T-complex protein 1 subunit gamma n=1 Tax=Dermatophagoides pteronyssinus TaxID=6956 RepID=A0ABQ8J260_DERPT|nr:T-complex protein 1 subunit gamma [Dermatophagoides pteronyssinus]
MAQEEEDDPNHVWISLDESRKHQNWELLECINWQNMCTAIYEIISKPAIIRPSLLLIDGHIIFNYLPLSNIFHRKYFIRTYNKSMILERRLKRNYIPADPPGYYDQYVWPMYLKNLEKISFQKDIQYIDGSLSIDHIYKQIIDDLDKFIQIIMYAPQILVLKDTMQRESGPKVQLENVKAAKAIADVIRTSLGPRAMLKMLMNPMGSIVMTNDGNAILREITVKHPAAKTMIEISRTQDEEVGDGTTSVIILAGEFLALAQQFLEQKIHPTIIVSAYRQALDDALIALKEKIAIAIDVKNDAKVLELIQSCIGTKILGKLGDFACKLALNAVRTVLVEKNGRKEIEVKKYIRIEKIPGASIEESCVLDGILLNKDVLHPNMRREIENPRILLLDCGLEYKKGESQTEIEITKEEDFARLLEIEEEYIKKICDDIIRFKPDLVITEKGVSDLAIHYMTKANISVLRRVKKQDNNRIARATGATVVFRTEEIREEDIGTGYPKACTLLLRGASKDMLNEIERNLQDAMYVARNILLDPYVLPGGGAVEMAVGKILNEKAKSIKSVHQWPYRVVAKALEVIPRTLIQNCGGDTIRTLTQLRAKHSSVENKTWGIDGEKGVLADMTQLGVWEPLVVKTQAYKTAIETAILLLRIDEIVSGSKKRETLESEKRADQAAAAAAAPTEESMKDD